jgi:hypothetical protein
MQGLRMLERRLRKTLNVGKKVNTIHGMKIGARKEAIMFECKDFKMCWEDI